MRRVFLGLLVLIVVLFGEREREGERKKEEEKGGREDTSTQEDDSKRYVPTSYHLPCLILIT